MNRFQILKLPEDYVPCFAYKEPKEEKENHIRDLLATSEGRQRLAASMAQPLRTRIDYEGVARRAFSVQPLPEGALAHSDSMEPSPRFNSMEPSPVFINCTMTV